MLFLTAACCAEAYKDVITIVGVSVAVSHFLHLITQSRVATGRDNSIKKSDYYSKINSSSLIAPCQWLSPLQLWLTDSGEQKKRQYKTLHLFDTAAFV